MIDKYYTPDIEEFHVGFEFESNYVLFNNTGGEEWKKITMSGDEFEWFHSAYKQDAYHTEFRVKYLDKEDIESFGFKYCKTNRLTYWYEIEFSGNNLPGDSSYKYWKIELLHYPKGNTIIIKSDTSDAENYTFFEGSIKNKSELKKLLKQLNIK